MADDPYAAPVPLPPFLRVLPAVAAGGAVGGLGRWGVGEAVAVEPGAFPWTTFVVNVVGSALLALLPALSVVRRRPVLVAFLGPGVLGGFTTLSAYSEEGRALLADGRTATAAAYLLGTLAACLVAVALVDRLSTPESREEFEAEEGDL